MNFPHVRCRTIPMGNRKVLVFVVVRIKIRKSSLGRRSLRNVVMNLVIILRPVIRNIDSVILLILILSSLISVHVVVLLRRYRKREHARGIVILFVLRSWIMRCHIILLKNTLTILDVGMVKIVLVYRLILRFVITFIGGNRLIGGPPVRRYTGGELINSMVIIFCFRLQACKAIVKASLVALHRYWNRALVILIALILRVSRKWSVVPVVPPRPILMNLIRQMLTSKVLRSILRKNWPLIRESFMALSPRKRVVTFFLLGLVTRKIRRLICWEAVALLVLKRLASLR